MSLMLLLTMYSLCDNFIPTVLGGLQGRVTSAVSFILSCYINWAIDSNHSRTENLIQFSSD